jgi:2-methylcitrate dehydratase PrpD
VDTEAPVTDGLSAYVAGSGHHDLPDAVADLARQHLLDTLAAIVACRHLPAARLARAYAEAQSGRETGGTAIPGTTARAGLVDAVFAAAMAGHAAELNDFCPSAFVQPGPAVVSTVLGVAAQRGASGATALRALVVGYELACRMPRALGTRNLQVAGLASHGIGPTFGAAAAASALLGLSERQVASVWALCAQQASGSWQWLLDVDHHEKAFVFAGMGARNGLQAALLVDAGLIGVAGALDRPGAWLGAGPFGRPGSDLDRRSLTDGLGSSSALPTVGFKRFPVGGPAQPAVQAMLELTAGGAVRPDDVEAVRIAMPGRVAAFATAGMPALNLPYLCAVILLDGRLDVDAAQSRERMTTDPAVAALMGRVTVVHDPDQEREPRAESARVTITRSAGPPLAAFVPAVEGYPSHPMPAAMVRTKAHGLLAPALGEEGAARVVDLVGVIDTLPSVDPLVHALRPVDVAVGP